MFRQTTGITPSIGKTSSILILVAFPQRYPTLFIPSDLPSRTTDRRRLGATRLMIDRIGKGGGGGGGGEMEEGELAHAM